MINRIKKNRSGQALVEYIIIFSFIAFFGIKLVQSFNAMMNETMNGLSYVLSQHLTAGVCKDQCFFGGYKNQ